jgi:polysaccharide export outer membrane protein
MFTSRVKTTLCCLLTSLLLSAPALAGDAGTAPSPMLQASIANGPAAPASNVKAASGVAGQPYFNSNQAAYVIGANDLLQIQVFQVDELSKVVRVSSSGMISLPLIGAIQAGGRTAQELEGEIAAQLSKTYLLDPQVSVFIQEYTSQRVTIEGSVKSAGIYPLKGRTTLIQAVAMASGLDPLADEDNIRVFRMVNGEKASLVFNMESIRSGKIEDPMVQGDDVIVVEKSTSKNILKNITDTLRGFISFGTL